MFVHTDFLRSLVHFSRLPALPTPHNDWVQQLPIPLQEGNTQGM